MCGLFGAIQLGGRFPAHRYDAFVALTDLVAYRGPDDADYRTFDVKVGDSQPVDGFDTFLGHRRLAIIDLSAEGRNPLTDDGKCWITFNGEIFNYVELREELRARGHVFKTETDTEVILKVYRQFGEEGFARLNGMWAFAIVDLERRRVVLSRDRFSIKPLYLLQRDGALYFASEAKQLMSLLPRCEVNRAVMYQYLTQALLDHSSETFFAGITTLKPKHNLVLDLVHGTIQERPYWDYRLREIAGERAALEEFSALLGDSIRIRLRSDVKIGALVSGGLDSSAIAVTANRLLEGKLETYSVVSDDSRFSEETFVDLLTKATGLRNERLRFRSNAALQGFEKVIWHNDEPFLGFHAIAQFQLLERIKQETDITVLLSGQGGDECLLGYSKFFFFHVHDLLHRGHVVQAFRHLLASALKRTVVWQFNLAAARRYLPWRRARQHFPYVLLRGEHEPVGRAATLAERQCLDLDKYSVPPQTHFEDRNSMAHSLEMRLPFLDHRLVEFLVSLPVAFKIHDGWTKYVARAALEELPAQIRWRRDKQGFLTPEESWLRHDLRERILDMFESKSRLHDLGVIDQKKFVESYRQFLGGSPLVWYADISRVVIAETWARTFLN
jgi:asparagine synthase (glutamine-hydrolysing)